MFRIAILGCENSHAAGFLKAIQNEKLEDIQVVGVYSCFEGEAEKLRDTYGVPVMKNYDELVGKIDGLVITARHGDNHYKYAKPYISSKIPMFIDKPITISEDEAREFAQELKDKQIPVSGGSSVKHADYVKELKEMVASGKKGSVVGGFLRMPSDIHSEHGGFFFYAQHLVQTVCEIFGYYPNAVRACRCGDQTTCVFRYDNFDITGLYVDKSYSYHATIVFEKSVESQPIVLGDVTAKEFHDFYALLLGKPQSQSYEDMFAPVFIMNAIERAVHSGVEEPVHRI